MTVPMPMMSVGTGVGRREVTQRGQRYISGVVRIPPDLPLAIMDVTIGALLIVGGERRAANSMFTVARRLLPIDFWGVAFIVLGLLLMLSLRWAQRESFVSAVRIIGPTLCVMWAVMYLLSALSSSVASFIGVPSYLYLAFRHHFAPIRPVG